MSALGAAEKEVVEAESLGSSISSRRLMRSASLRPQGAIILLSDIFCWAVTGPSSAERTMGRVILESCSLTDISGVFFAFEPLRFSAGLAVLFLL